MLVKFIRFIPAFYRLFRDYEMEPDDIRFSLKQYRQVMLTLTNNKLSNLNYYANTVINEIVECMTSLGE